MDGIASETQSVSKTEETQNHSLLLKIADVKIPVPSESKKPQIQKVALTLREIESNKGCFNPLVASFGPCHHHEDRLDRMKSSKVVAARWFVLHSRADSDPEIELNQETVMNVYNKFVKKAGTYSDLRGCYADDIVKGWEEEKFMEMMFLDGCFILHFIHHVMSPSDDYPLNISNLDIALVLRDMFLLENQIPYAILEALMSLMPKKNQPNGSNQIQRFIDLVSLPEDKSSSSPGRFTSCITKLLEKFSNFTNKKNMSSTGGGSNSAKKEKEYEPIHLLDFLRFRLVGEDRPKAPGTACSQYYFRSIKDLKAAGMKLKRSNSKNLRDIKFEEGRIQGYLHLPQLVVDDATKSRLLNLVAYEMYPGFFSDSAVTSYVCFLDSLIDRAEDVKELRSKNILRNGLGSDEEVAKLFNEVGTHLVPDCHTYSEVMKQIDEHSQNHVKVWIGEFMHAHFSSPWTVIALFGGISVILLALVQTIYAAKGK